MSGHSEVSLCMYDILDSVFTYVLALLSIALATVVVHAGVAMTIGGLVLLVLRLYVDGKRAWHMWKGKYYDH
jgi:hypothetical protein